MKVLLLACLWLAVSYSVCGLVAHNLARRRLRSSREDQFANWRRFPAHWSERT